MYFILTQFLHHVKYWILQSAVPKVNYFMLLYTTNKWTNLNCTVGFYIYSHNSITLLLPIKTSMLFVFAIFDVRFIHTASGILVRHINILFRVVLCKEGWGRCRDINSNSSINLYAPTNVISIKTCTNFRDCFLCTREHVTYTHNTCSFPFIIFV